MAELSRHVACASPRALKQSLAGERSEKTLELQGITNFEGVMGVKITPEGPPDDDGEPRDSEDGDDDCKGLL